MAQHKEQGNLARERVRFCYVEGPVGNAMHHPGAYKIEQETCPERYNMPGFKITGKPFSPDSKGIKNQSEANVKGRSEHFL
jgi:hypothetical protein